MQGAAIAYIPASHGVTTKVRIWTVYLRARLTHICIFTRASSSSELLLTIQANRN